MIRGADTIVFVLSPDSATSEICAWEVEEKKTAPKKKAAKKKAAKKKAPAKKKAAKK